MRIKVLKNVFEALIENAVKKPEELVFIGIGRIVGDDVIIEEFFKCKNISENPKTRFKADPMCVYTAFKYAEKNNLALAAIVHSHPAPPYPSNLDLRSMKNWDVPWIIIDSIRGNAKAWIINDDIIEIHLELLNDDCGRN